jgi:hypothetical protein
MRSKDEEFPRDSLERWIADVSTLQSLISAKLFAIGFLHAGEDDNISHHLAEVAYLGPNVGRNVVPAFLESGDADLPDLTVDLVEDLRELKEAIESMEADLVTLMNYANR